MRRAVVVAVACLLAAFAAGGSGTAWAAEPAGSTGPLGLEARIGGQVVGAGDLVIDPTRETNIEITVRNETSSLLRVKTVRLSGTALALTFFAYDTTVAFDVPAGATVERSFPLDLADLDQQATGLLPATVQLLAPDRTVLSEVAATSDVRGSVWSVFGVFGIAVVVMTLLAWAGALVSLARGRLPANRWRRALRFLPAGFGTGLSAVITLSVLRLVAPAPAAEIPMVLGAAAAAFLLGYLTPHPNPAVAPDEASLGQGPTEHIGGVDPAAPGQYPPGSYLPGQYPPGPAVGQGLGGAVGQAHGQGLGQAAGVAVGQVPGQGLGQGFGVAAGQAPGHGLGQAAGPGSGPGQHGPGQYPAGQLPPGLLPPADPGSPAEQPTEAHQVPVPNRQQWPPQEQPQAQPQPQQWPPQEQAQAQPQAPQGRPWVPADPDATVDADATMQAGLLSGFLERPDGRR